MALRVHDVEGAAQVALIPEALHLGSVGSGPLERHEAQSQASIEPGQPSGHPRTEAAASVVKDRQADVRRREPLLDRGCRSGAGPLDHEARSRVGRTWMRTG